MLSPATAGAETDSPMPTNPYMMLFTVTSFSLAEGMVSWDGPFCSPVDGDASQTRMTPSSPAVTKDLPSGVNRATLMPVLSVPGANVATVRWGNFAGFVTSHSLAVPSRLADRSRVPSGEYWTLVTRRVCPLNVSVLLCEPTSGCHCQFVKSIRPSSPAAASHRPSGENARAPRLPRLMQPVLALAVEGYTM